MNVNLTSSLNVVEMVVVPFELHVSENARVYVHVTEKQKEYRSGCFAYLCRACCR